MNFPAQNYDIYTTFSVSAALELPADLLCIYLLDVLGRRWSAFASFVLSSAFMLACSFTLNSTTGTDLISYSDIDNSDTVPCQSLRMTFF